MSRTVVALRRSAVESTLKAVAFDQLALPTACVNLSGQVLTANAAFASLIGASLEQLIGRTLFERVDPCMQPAFARRWARLLGRVQAGEPARGVINWLRSDGSRIRVRVEARLGMIDAERIALLTAQEIGVEQAARRARSLLAARQDALAVAESPGFLLCGDRRVVAANAAAESLKQDPALEFAGLPFDYLLDESSADEFRRAFERITSGEDTSARLGLRLRQQVDGDRRQWRGELARADGRAGASMLVVLREAASAPEGAPSSARQLELRERLLQLAMESRRDFASSLSQLLRVVATTLKASRVGFWAHDAASGRLRCESMFVTREDRFAHDWTGVEFPAAAAAAYLQALRQRQPLVVHELATQSDLAPLRGERRFAAVGAMLDVPVLVDGEVRGVLSLHSDVPRRWDDDEIGFASTAALMTALAMEAAQRQQAESRIEQLAWYDTLTGLPNRNLLREMLRDMVLSAADRKRRIALMLIDLDRFKDVNDTLGHLVGDALIKSAAQVLREMVGGRGMVGRLGGDEFVVVLNDFAHRQEVAQFAARMAQALHRTDLVPNIDTQVSASIGIALFPEHGREMSTLMKNADAAMYQAKRDGRNQFSFFNPIRHEHAAREVQLGIQLLKALHGGAAQFFVEYQPQVSLATGRVVGLEALIRWQHPAYGRLTPERFIGVAEASGLSERITRWLIGEVCAQVLRWRERQPGFDIPIAVNIAGRELGSASLPSIMRSALRQHAIEPAMITLEVTERTLVKQSETNNDVMAELASIGVGLVLDDFGTGYSMLGYLKRMPIQSLKIDGSFIEGVPDDADSCAIVHAVLAVARHFKLKVIAEGIETAAQVEYLRSIGCEYGQGFYYSRPLLPQTILDYVELDPPAGGERTAH